MNVNDKHRYKCMIDSYFCTADITLYVPSIVKQLGSTARKILWV